MQTEAHWFLPYEEPITAFSSTSFLFAWPQKAPTSLLVLSRRFFADTPIVFGCSLSPTVGSPYKTNLPLIPTNSQPSSPKPAHVSNYTSFICISMYVNKHFSGVRVLTFYQIIRRIYNLNDGLDNIALLNELMYPVILKPHY